MKRRSLLWTVYPYYLVIIIASLALTAWYASSQMTHLYMDEISAALETRAYMVRLQLAPALADPTPEQIQRLTKELGAISETRITVIDNEGTVLGDSEQDPGLMENHGTRPEIAIAYTGATGIQTRYSNTLQTSMIYVAVPVMIEGQQVGVVRTSQPLTAVQQALYQLYERFVLVGLVIAILATIISYLVFQRLTRPLRQIRAGTEKFSRGELDTRLPISHIEEIAALSETMNAMAQQLDQRMLAMAKQHNEREAILASMSDGLVALDPDKKIASLNQAAAVLLGLDPTLALGQSIYEVARSTVLHELVKQAAESGELVEAEIILNEPDEKHLQVHATALKESHGSQVGIVLLFTDITRLKKLERMRRDFVANVSHELKTPITAISGSVETLADGAFDETDNRDRFLAMIARHARRLDALVDDLLSLARLEDEAERGEIELTRGKVADVLQAAVQVCQPKASQGDIELTLKVDTSITARFNFRQLEQAVINLIDNAIKYSDHGGQVVISVNTGDGELVIEVTDRGIGIEPRHLSRLFERFYRVDTARSRETGGTGLGLSIVKHIALAHHGRVSVDSRPAAGSTFRIHLPDTD